MKPNQTLTRKQLADAFQCSVKTIYRREQTILRGARIGGIRPARYSASKVNQILK